MTMCGACSGTGKRTCPSCGGKRRHTRFTPSGVGGIETNPCVVCAASGQVRCDFCRGRGTIDTSAGGSPPPPTRKRDPDADPLEGRWQDANGGWYEFQKTSTGYRVITGSAIGATGEGTATLTDNKVLLEVNLPILGKIQQEFELRENQLVGYITMLGMRVPMVLRPV